MKKKIISALITVLIIVLAVLLCGTVLNKDVGKKEKIESIADLKGKNIALLTGSVMDTIALQYIENPNIIYCTSDPDCAVMLAKGKVDAHVTDEPISRIIKKNYPNFDTLATLTKNEYSFIFNKESSESSELCQSVNEYIKKIKQDGTLEAIDAIWFGEDESKKVIDLPVAEEGKRTVVFGTCSSVGAPFAYVKDRQYVGYDIDIIARFCRENGYGLEIKDYDFLGLLAAVQSSKHEIDLGGACITVTEERAEKVLFSESTYSGGVIVIVNGGDGGSITDGFNVSGFFAGLKEKFEATFIKEERWLLFVDGILRTLFITALAIVFGSVIGFLIFWGSRELEGTFKIFAIVFSKLVSGMPAVVFLMIMYYVVFATSQLSATAVAVVSFSLVFGSSVYGMLKNSADTISTAQTEASLALGFTSTQTLFKVILPQALRHFLPLFRAEIISLIKATAVVGYISVQDLTKMSDIVRSRTYDAFFPLIVSAIIYYALEIILVALVNGISVSTDTKRRSADKILKGVKRR